MLLCIEFNDCTMIFRNLCRIASLALFSLLMAAHSQAQSLPSKKDILKTLTLANQYFMNKWPDPGKEIHVPSRNRTWPSNIWTRAVYYEGLMALYSIDKKKAYLD